MADPQQVAARVQAMIDTAEPVTEEQQRARARLRMMESLDTTTMLGFVRNLVDHQPIALER